MTMKQNNQPDPHTQPDPYRSFASARYYTLYTRRFLALMALTWGFMLGGGFLLLLTAVLVALVRGNAYIAAVVLTLEAVLVLRGLWVIGYWLLRTPEPRVTKMTQVISVFMAATAYSFLLPFLFAQSFAAEVRRQSEAIDKQDTPAGFTNLFNRMAHIN